MNERPEVVCECGAQMKKGISRCNIISRNSSMNRMVGDAFRQENDMRAELRDDYGIEKFSPFGVTTTAAILRDVRASGTYVKDQMACEKQKQEEKRAAKLREWRPKAQRRASGRRAEMRDRKEAEASAKRRITI
jgi:hypothetical protein